MTDTPHPEQPTRCPTCGSDDWFFDLADGTMVVHDGRARPCPDPFHTPEQPTEAGERLTAVTMTPEAAERFKAALLWGYAQRPDEPLTNAAANKQREAIEHADWLRWGVSRIDAAVPASLARSERERADRAEEGLRVDAEIRWWRADRAAERERVERLEAALRAAGRVFDRAAGKLINSPPSNREPAVVGEALRDALRDVNAALRKGSTGA